MDAEATKGGTAGPVATREYLAGLKGEDLKRWRTAPLPERRPPGERAIDLPLPFGWFVICYSDELAAGQVKHVRYFGRELVLWRGEDGEPRMLDDDRVVPVHHTDRLHADRADGAGLDDAGGDLERAVGHAPVVGLADRVELDAERVGDHLHRRSPGADLGALR